MGGDGQHLPIACGPSARRRRGGSRQTDGAGVHPDRELQAELAGSPARILGNDQSAICPLIDSLRFDFRIRALRPLGRDQWDTVSNTPFSSAWRRVKSNSPSPDPDPPRPLQQFDRYARRSRPLPGFDFQIAPDPELQDELHHSCRAKNPSNLGDSPGDLGSRF